MTNEANKKQSGLSAQVESKTDWLKLVRDQIAFLRFGTVVITVHDGRVVQVEKNEKLRLDHTASTRAIREQNG